MNYACRKCQMSCWYQVAKILPYNPPIITHEISNFILYDMCMRDDYHAHISHLSGIMKRHFFPSDTAWTLGVNVLVNMIHTARTLGVNVLVNMIHTAWTLKCTSKYDTYSPDSGGNCTSKYDI